MNINLTGHHTQITPALRATVSKKLERLERCGDLITSINMVLNVDKLMQTAEATLHLVPRVEIHASATSKDMYTAIDELIDKLERQINKHREKLHTHRNNNQSDEL